MKGILVKRLESSFFAFKKSVGRFLNSYDEFIQMFDSGRVLISKTVNVYDLLDDDDEENILKLIEKDKVQEYKASEFKPEFRSALEHDRQVLAQINDLW